jgi:hypothetical protein
MTTTQHNSVVPHQIQGKAMLVNTTVAATIGHHNHPLRLNNDVTTTARAYAVHLFRYSQSLGWQKFNPAGDGGDATTTTTTIRVIPHRFFLALPDIKTRVWLVDRQNHPRTIIITATIVRRGDRVKIACTSTPTILILVFANINDAVDFCDQVSSATSSGIIPDDDAAAAGGLDPQVLYEAERERGVETLSYAARLLTDRHFLEFAQNLEQALTASTDGRALLEQFLYQLSGPL